VDGMVLEIFVLSVLRAGPAHGYELKRKVQRPSLTPLSNNSLYPMLRRFESAGLVTKTIEEQDGRPARNVFAITTAGRERLATLLETLPTELAANDEEFLVRVSFFPELSPANQRAILSARAAALDARHAQVSALLEATQESPRTAWRALVMQHVLDTSQRERSWLADLEARAHLDPKAVTP
jgi:DNA-binding PadR family transcriptional regulator